MKNSVAVDAGNNYSFRSPLSIDFTKNINSPVQGNHRFPHSGQEQSDFRDFRPAETTQQRHPVGWLKLFFEIRHWSAYKFSGSKPRSPRARPSVIF
jgi:hypothetical protein